MRRVFAYILIALAAVCLAACSKPVSHNVPSGRYIRTEETTKLSPAGNTILWNNGDLLALFFSGDTPEKWYYSGADGTSDGQITNTDGSFHFDDEECYALYPYSASALLDGETISTAIPQAQGFGFMPILCGHSVGNVIYLQHAGSYIRMDLSGCGVITQAVLSGNNGEYLSGAVSIDLAGDIPSCILSGTGTSVTLSGEGLSIAEKPSSVWFSLPPLDLPGGFTVEFRFADNTTSTFVYTEPLTLQRGQVFSCREDIICTSALTSVTMDFTGKNQPFTDPIPSTLTVYNPTTGFDNGRTFYTKEGNYPVVFMTLKGNADSSCGLLYYASLDCLLMGRQGSYIKIPSIPGHLLYSVEYLSANANGKPYISSDAAGKWHESNMIHNPAQDELEQMTLITRKPDMQYYMYISSGNIGIKKLTFNYIPE